MLLTPTIEALAITWFTVIRTVIVNKFDTAIESTYSQITTLLVAVIAPTLTALIMFEGFRIISGKSTDSAAAFAIKWTKIVALISFAGFIGVANSSVNEFVKSALELVSTTITGDTTDVYKMIDTNLKAASMLSVLTNLITADTGAENEASKLVATAAAGLGAVMPIVTALFTALLLELTMKLAIALAPIFIFAALFERTAEWLFTLAKFVLATAITTAVMAIMAKICITEVALTSVAALLAYEEGVSVLYMSMLSAINGLCMSLLLIAVPGVVMKLFGMAADSAMSNQLGKEKDSGKHLRFGNRNV